MILACLYLSLGLSAHDQIRSVSGQYWRWDMNETHNPYGVAAVGCEYRFSQKVTLDVSARHESSAPVNDRGVNSLQVSVKWSPWR